MMTPDKLTDIYKTTHPHSFNSHERALSVFAADGATHFSRILSPHGPYITRAKGSREWDADGNEYIDYKMGHGALILGHCHLAIVQAIQEQLTKGVHYSHNNEIEVRWAETIKSMMPVAERVEFFSCGQEANLLALRLSRVFTGRRKVLRFEGHFHGWADELTTPDSPGVVSEHVKIIPANDIDIVEAELATREYAILMTEGDGGSLGRQVPLDDSVIRALRDLTKKYGTVWLIDEVVTGFREAPGGWQSLVGIIPDLTSLGKCVGGGLGAGALLGRADILSSLSAKAPPERRIQHSGTWNANPLTASAGLTACRLYLSGEIQKKISKRASQFRQKGNQLFRDMKIDARFYGGSMVNLYLGPIDYEPEDDRMPPTKDAKKIFASAANPGRGRLSLHLIQTGIATPMARYFAFSVAHTAEDVEQTIKALADSIEAVTKEGSLK